MVIQGATEHAIKAWYEADDVPEVDTDGAKAWGTFLPVGGPDEFKAVCTERGITYVQGLAQALTLWLGNRPSPTTPLVSQPVVRPAEGAAVQRIHRRPPNPTRRPNPPATG